ncbi:hypothetical protein [Sphingobacterium sp.]|uniref:hypothetical protein n=1 Tax=Sphingobacterium sp. TaxID=341027 RepID=UPI002898A200|nr:hypothetical protein [Sphingobacterium sp.]
MPVNQKVILYKPPLKAQFPEDFQNRFHTHIYCQSGWIKFVFDGRKFHCKKGEFIFWLAGLPISELSVSTNFKATILFVDKDLLTTSLPSATVSIDSYIHARENPILHPDKRDREKILRNFELLYDKSVELTTGFTRKRSNSKCNCFCSKCGMFLKMNWIEESGVCRAVACMKGLYSWCKSIA